jgi:hypothetical protein
MGFEHYCIRSCTESLDWQPTGARALAPSIPRIQRVGLDARQFRGGVGRTGRCRRVFPQELNLAVTRATLLSSAVDIYRATGGGWVNEADKLAPQPVAGSGWFAPTLPSAPPPAQVSTKSP